MSSERAKEIRVQTARDLEARGFIDKAVKTYISAGAPGEAARLLVSQERYLDAGKLMLDALGVGPDDAGALEGKMRSAAEKTARCFELGGDLEMAVRLRRALGIENEGTAMGRPSMAPDVLPEHAPKSSVPPASESSSRVSVFSKGRSAPQTGERWGRASGWKAGSKSGEEAIDLAIEQLLEQGKKNSAARVAWDAGRLSKAAQLFAESGLDYELGSVLYDLGQYDEAMEAFLRVPPEHKRHRVACVKLVDIANRLGRFDFELDRMLTQFAKAPPLEASEVATYLMLADLYVRNEFGEGARNVLEQVLLHDPTHEAARLALEALPPSQDSRRVVSEPPRRAPATSIAQPGIRALPPLPSLDELIREARKYAPKRNSESSR